MSTYNFIQWWKKYHNTFSKCQYNTVKLLSMYSKVSTIQNHYKNYVVVERCPDLYLLALVHNCKSESNVYYMAASSS